MLRQSSPKTIYPVVELLRAEARAMRYAPATDMEIAEAREADRVAIAVNAIEGLHPDAEDDAFHQMMIDERLPPALRLKFMLRYADAIAPSR